MSAGFLVCLSVQTSRQLTDTFLQTWKQHIGHVSRTFGKSVSIKHSSDSQKTKKSPQARVNLFEFCRSNFPVYLPRKCLDVTQMNRTLRCSLECDQNTDTSLSAASQLSGRVGSGDVVLSEEIHERRTKGHRRLGGAAWPRPSASPASSSTSAHIHVSH